LPCRQTGKTKCKYRYGRGIDRADEAALRPACWPDAHDTHGATDGPVELFFEPVRLAWACKPRNVHNDHNGLIEFLDPCRSAVESDFTAFQHGKAPGGTVRQVLLPRRRAGRREDGNA